MPVKYKNLNLILATALLLAGVSPSFSQGFINLDFESAVITLDSSSPYYPYAAIANNAIPGWTAYLGTTPQTYIVYNTVSLGAPSVDLEGTNSAFTPIQGAYFILLQGDNAGFNVSASIGQTAQIPPSALSLIFWGGGILNVTFGGQPISFSHTSGAANYNIYTADISTYAGQTGELLFTTPTRKSAALDNIMFSTSPVPEPGTLALTAIGLSCLALRHRKKSAL